MRFFIFTAALFFALPSLTLAADTAILGGPIVPECETWGGICQACDVITLVDNVLKFLVAFTTVIAALMFLYAGLLYVTAAAKPANIDTAKKIFSTVLFGLIIVLVAWLIIDIIMRVFTNQDLNVLTQIECVEFDDQVGGYVGTGDTGGSGDGDIGAGGPTGTSQRYDAPAGSCVASSQELAARPDIQETPNCKPGDRVANYGDGQTVINNIQQNFGETINGCAAEQGIPPSVLVGISRLECNGARTCNDPANTSVACKKGGYGATGVSCASVRSYCRANPSNPSCSGVSSMNNTQLVSTIRSDPSLAFCSTARNMRNQYSKYGNWGLAAASYNGAGGLEPSKSCKGYMIMQCPVAGSNVRFPYCQITCAYYDVFNDTVQKAGGT
ncbi:MAG: hypothetical protein AAB573_04195 [Patescibacteria group bacterium]